MAFEFEQGAVSRPQKIVIYGPEGVGKTTLASKFPAPLFGDCEEGTDHIDLARVRIKDMKKFRETCLNLINEPHQFETFVVDTIDWLASQDRVEMLKDDNQDSIEDYGFGKGFTKLAERFNDDILHMLDRVAKSGVHVVLLGHTDIQKFEEPDKQGSYDRYKLKLDKKIAPLVKEWCDSLFFINHETKIVDRNKSGDGAKRGVATKKRMIYTVHSAAYDAKSRVDLPDSVEAKIENLRPAFADFKRDVSPPKQSTAKTAESSGEEMTLEKVIEMSGGQEAVEAFLGSRNLSIEKLNDDYISRVLAKPDIFAMGVQQFAKQSAKQSAG